MKFKYVLFYLLIVGVSCRKDLTSSGLSRSNSSLITFKFEHAKNPKLQEDIIADISDTTISCTLPIGISPDSLTATFEINPLVNSVAVGTVEQKSGSSMNDFTQTLHYTVYGRDNLVRTYLVKVNVFTGLPVVNITTNSDSAVTSKDYYVNGKILINGNFTGFSNFEANMQIKLHGNSTIAFPKKPYKIKLLSKASLLGMPADKEWLLLANYVDKSLMRDDVAFEVSRIFGMPYTPRSQFVEVYLNGVFEGNYQLTEQIKISSDRVNIKEMDADDTSATKITGGYLLEVDNRDKDDVYFETSKNVDVVLNDPDGTVASQTSYIKNYVQQMENAIYSADFADPAKGYSKYMNPETTIEWFWVNELFKNNDAKFISSTYLYKDRSSILNFGPVWDFDIAAGNTYLNGCNDPKGWYLKDAPWFSGLFHDPVFVQKTITKWNAVRSRLDSLSNYIDQNAFKLKYSQARNFETWDILKTYVYLNNEVAGSYEGEVRYLKEWLLARMKWIDANLQTLQN